MHCPFCGKELPEGSGFCAFCGKQIDSSIGSAAPPQATDSVTPTHVPDDATPMQVADDTASAQGFDSNTPTDPNLPKTPQEFTPSTDSGAGRVGTIPIPPVIGPNQADDINPPVVQTNPADDDTSKKGSGRIIAGIVGAIVGIALIAAFVIFALPNIIGPKHYTLTLEKGDGTTIATQEYAEDEAINAPADPIWDGYYFVCWKYADGTDAYFPMHISKDTTLVAQWEKDYYSYDDDDYDYDDTNNPAETSSSDDDTVPDYPNGTDSTLLHVQAADGSDLNGAVYYDVYGSVLGRYHLGNWDTVTYSVEEIKNLGMSDAELCVAWNEIVASANGYAFKNSGLRDYFSNVCNYTGTTDNDSLSGHAKENSDNLKACLSDKRWLKLKTD